ncbi:MAG: hypothetical protein IT379_05065 [Deltaproteobacteria bacterium]|nr:hypothetical protein [Deltaproteobacteria bacterium]
MLEEPAPTLSDARQSLLEALSWLPRIGDAEVLVRASEAEMAVSLHHVYRALHGRSDPEAFASAVASALDGARRALETLQQTPPTDEAHVEVMRCAAGALTALLSPRFDPHEPPLDLPRAEDASSPVRAVVGMPRTVRPARAPWLPVIPLPELDPPEEKVAAEPVAAPVIEDLAGVERLVQDAERKLEAMTAPRAPAAAPEAPAPRTMEAIKTVVEERLVGGALTEHEVTVSHARALLEELAMFGLQRRGAAGVPWRDCGRVEARLLTRLDALVALRESVMPAVVKLLERPLPDPELTWAVLFLLGSIEGDDSLDQAWLVVRAAAFDDALVAAAIGDALALAPHAGLDGWVYGWLGAADPVRRATGLEVLSRRGTLSSEDAAAAALDDDIRVVRVAARALGTSRGVVPSATFAPLLAHPDKHVQRAAIESSILRRSEMGVMRAYQWVLTGKAAHMGAALYVAIAGGPEAYDTLRRAITEDRPTSTLVRAVGWFGHPGLVPQVIDVLAATKKASVKLAAAEALWRITGAPVTDDEPDPEHPGLDRPHARDLAPPVVEPELTQDAELWRAWWRRHQSEVRSGTRYRFGHSWSPADDVWQMEEDLASPEDRRLAHLELVARTGETLPFDSRAFAAIQQTQIDAWRDRVSQRFPSTEWPTRFR